MGIQQLPCTAVTIPISTVYAYLPSVLLRGHPAAPTGKISLMPAISKPTDPLVQKPVMTRG